ncbi:hypothetical protein [Aidingimonas lacisalsi]|uniref:hypothetical protein n=1 Tax=Aidingimonas lacisalsi TaxID=2604086 RepID=UPI0011D263B7|nr:hypothetical protein [Aidingimonas lacisalsi]
MGNSSHWVKGGVTIAAAHLLKTYRPLAHYDPLANIPDDGVAEQSRSTVMKTIAMEASMVLTAQEWAGTPGFRAPWASTHSQRMAMH